MSSGQYQPLVTEPHWQAEWEKRGLFQNSVQVPVTDKMYILYAFAYPSGSGLHVGHVEPKTALDILVRYYRMKGKQVFFPVGWDAFGLPAENYAIKTGIHPAQTTKSAIDTFKRQIKRLGISYDWQSEIATCHPGYYKFTQWLFLQLYQKGLAYQGVGMVNWCPSCQTVLANEQVVEGQCERCGTAVIQKEMKQWFFRITQYQDELISGLDQVDWPAATKQQQLNWIGKSQGLTINFELKNAQKSDKILLPVWTKFWETVYGVTFLVIAPEKFVALGLNRFLTQNNKQKVQAYIDAAGHKTEEERKIGEKDKTGVDTGLQVVNPVNGQTVPLFVADYVLSGVGTAIVMGVPAHDQRDFTFAKKYKLPIVQVISYQDPQLESLVAEGRGAVEADGVMINSGSFDGQPAWSQAKPAIAKWLIKQGYGQWQTTYKLRDWLISRQRYWGAPIPIVYDPQGQPHPVREEHLPWLLPTDVDFKPTGESPLHSSREFMARTEKLYGKGWRPEFDTMDTFVDSSWYYLRYADARNQDEFASSDMLKQWQPVDFYMIGPEHIVLHLLYSRFFTKFLRDQGYLNFDEPFMKMRHQGMILGPDGRKMSKSKGNVVNPDDVIEKFGADTLRVYEMFMGPIDADKPWNTRAVIGVYKFLNRVYNLVYKWTSSQSVTKSKDSVEAQTALVAVKRKLHQTIAKVSRDLPELKFNTAVASLMELTNTLETAERRHGVQLDQSEIKLYLGLLAPLAPFLAEELFAMTGASQSIHQSSWPVADPDLCQDQNLTLAVQVNGKVRAEITVAVGETESRILTQAKNHPKIVKWLAGAKIKRQLYIPGRIVSFTLEAQE